MSFELLEHPADIGFRAQAVTLAQLFGECARALQFIMLEATDIQYNQQIQLNAEGTDYESLLVNWLNEVLYYIDSHRLVFEIFDIEVLDETRIECLAYGGLRDRVRNPDKLIVKAVTYHQLRITQTSKLLSADVYVDI